MLLLAAGTLAMVAGGWEMSRSSTKAAGDRGAGGGEGRRSGEAASFRNGGAASSGRRTRRAAAAVLLSLGAGLVALSALTVLLVRARHDPPLNQGAPSTLPALLQVVQRSQYHVAPIWPRQAPAWLQMGNLIQYADFQVAMGLGRGPVPTAPRVAVTLAFAALAIVGARAHRKSDGVGWAAVLMLLLAGGPGAVAQLNLKAGPSYGHGVLPDAAPREARERDYFFLTAFAGWGVWAGMGGIALSGRARGRSLGLAAIALPLAPVMLNFGATSARLSPDAQLARDAAELMLLSAPENAILLTAGDNDTYPLWYLQMAERVRPDVYVVPVAMLPADWFRAELASRAGLDARGSFPAERIASVIESAVDMNRPVAASPVLPLLAVPREYSMHQLSPPPPADAGTSRSTAGATNARGPQGWHWRGVVRVLDSGPHLPGLTERDSMAVLARLRRQAGSRLESEAQPTPKVDPAPDAVRARLLCAALRSGMWAPSRDTDLLARNCVVR